MLELLEKLAREFEAQMVSCMNTKNNIALTSFDAANNREYWAGKEQAFYESARSVREEMKSL
jgi:hypothetical protein